MMKKFLYKELVILDVGNVVVVEGVEPESRIKMFNFQVSLVIFTLSIIQKINLYDKYSI
jgi:hypothetical protein